MHEHKLRMKVTATAESSRRRVSPLYYDRVRKVVPAVAQCNCGGGGAIILIGTAGCGFYGPTDSQLQ